MQRQAKRLGSDYFTNGPDEVPIGSELPAWICRLQFSDRLIYLGNSSRERDDSVHVKT